MKNRQIIWILSIILIVLTTVLVIQYGQIRQYKAMSLSYESMNIDDSLADQRLQAEKDGHKATKSSLTQFEKDYALLEQKNKISEDKTVQLEALLQNGPELLNTDSQWALQGKFGEDYHWIVEDLLEHSELIERPGVLGGTMMFRKAWLLTDRLALAVFDDGHMMGSGIYDFYQRPDGTLQWSMVVEHVDGEDFFPVLQGDLKDWDVWQSHLYNTKNMQEVIELYREDLDGAYADDYGMRLMTMYISKGVDKFVEELYASNSKDTVEIETIFLEEVQIYGDIFGLNFKTVEKDLETMIDPNRVTFIAEFKALLHSMDK